MNPLKILGIGALMTAMTGGPAPELRAAAGTGVGLVQEEENSDLKLPSGKSQRQEILKADYKKSLEEAERLLQLAEELKADLERDEQHVLSLSSLKKTEEIEKLAKRIRTRLRHY